MVKRRRPPSQGWRTFLRNHAPDIAAMDLFVVPTIGFDLLYAFVIVRLDRGDLVWINVTAHPTSEWVARQITEAFPWDEAPRYLIRDRDRIYGSVVARRVRAIGIRDKPTAPAWPWQNGFAERLIGSIRREYVDHIIVLGEMHLRRILKSYADYYNGLRTHRSLNKDAPVSRLVQRAGVIRSRAILGGLHHRYARVQVVGTYTNKDTWQVGYAEGISKNERKAYVNGSNSIRPKANSAPSARALVTLKQAGILILLRVAQSSSACVRSRRPRATARRRHPVPDVRHFDSGSRHVEASIAGRDRRIGCPSCL